MGKIKINLSSGNVIEKPLVTCFQGNNAAYIVLDNEANGAMGLPIICISKFNGTTAEKIVDQNEWMSVKENLKAIIAGTNLSYINVPESISAQDDFFTQLTLPIESFDILKNKYAAFATPAQSTNIIQNNEVSVMPQVADNAVQNPAMPATPAMPEVNNAVSEMPMPPINTMEPDNVASSPMPQPVDSSMQPNDINPISINPVADVNSNIMEAPVVNQPQPMDNTNISPVGPINNDAPMADQSINAGNGDINAIKDNFMKSCEAMFDALIDKIQNQ